MRTDKIDFLPFGLIWLVSALTLAGLAFYAQNLIALDSIRVRFVYWPNGLSFIFMLLGVSGFLVLLIWRHYHRLSLFPFAVPLALLISLIPFTKISTGEPLRWTPLEAGTEFLPAVDLAAQKLARRENRPILYYFHADWCSGCPDFERYVLGDPLLSRKMEPFIKVKMDGTDHKWAEYLKANFGVIGFPAVAIRTRDNEIIGGPQFMGLDLSRRALINALEYASDKQAPTPAPDS
ncbi:MAG: hypothetical protein KDK30_00290 [Leptospiraceae bacterium]|nr:hypothetical protein [Leptospiraceae bacterium]MCB1315762.1 hypothetical protein [Leptospiraceae bacterium]MCB1323055.1 hypothetical protein [Leptospiraceae bacterium]